MAVLSGVGVSIELSEAKDAVGYAATMSWRQVEACREACWLADNVIALRDELLVGLLAAGSFDFSCCSLGVTKVDVVHEGQQSTSLYTKLR